MNNPSAAAPSVPLLLKRTSASYPDNVAVWTPARRLTYSQLVAESASLASALRDALGDSDDPVALVMPNIAEAYIAYFAVAQIGRRILPLNPRLTEREMDAAMARWAPELAICGGVTKDGSVTERVLSLRHRPGTIVSSDAARRGGLGGLPPSFDVIVRDSRGSHLDSAKEPAPDDDWLIQLTSGTTAEPKGVRLGHGQCVRMGYEIGRRLGLAAGDRYFVCNPVHHLGSTNFGLLAAIAHGATYYTMPYFEPDEALDIMVRERCTVHQGIGSHYLVEMTSPRLNPQALSLRTITVGGGPELARRIRDAFQSDGVVQRYGSSESGGAPICGSHDDPLPSRLDTMGRPLPGVEVRVADAGAGTVQSSGGEGEIQIRGWSVMKGYLHDAEATSTAIDTDGWLHTGDMGRLDADGNLLFISRLVDILRVGGENVAAREIEAVLESHPSVRQAQVIPIPHSILNEVPAAFVELEPGALFDPQQLAAFCTTNLARYKRPAKIWLITNGDWPMTGSGKVRKGALREMALEYIR
jgi:fatty-acyl-CoA synthase